MGDDDSQKLLPWRGISLLSGAQTSGSQQNQHQHCTGNGIGSLQEPVSATHGLDHFRKVHLDRFWQAPKGRPAPTVISSRPTAGKSPGCSPVWRHGYSAPPSPCSPATTPSCRSHSAHHSIAWMRNSMNLSIRRSRRRKLPKRSKTCHVH